MEKVYPSQVVASNLLRSLAREKLDPYEEFVFNERNGEFLGTGFKVSSLDNGVYDNLLIIEGNGMEWECPLNQVKLFHNWTDTDKPATYYTVKP
jgi:hypothetical protein